MEASTGLVRQLLELLEGGNDWLGREEDIAPEEPDHRPRKRACGRRQMRSVAWGAGTPRAG